MSYFFLLFGHLNCLIWLMYSIRIVSVELMIPNITCTIISFTNLCVYYLIAKKFFTFLVKYTVMCVVCCWIALAVLKVQEIGTMAVLMNMLVYLASFEQLYPVFEEKCNKYMDINILSVCLINSSTWFSFAVVAKDPFIVIPNFTGIIATIFMLTIYFWADNKLPNFICKWLADLVIKYEDPEKPSEKSKLIAL